jgi:hypothetical protein
MFANLLLKSLLKRFIKDSPVLPLQAVDMWSLRCNHPLRQLHFMPSHITHKVSTTTMVNTDIYKLFGEFFEPKSAGRH